MCVQEVGGFGTDPNPTTTTHSPPTCNPNLGGSVADPDYDNPSFSILDTGNFSQSPSLTLALLLEAWPVNSYPYVVQLPSGSVLVAAGLSTCLPLTSPVRQWTSACLHACLSVCPYVCMSADLSACVADRRYLAMQVPLWVPCTSTSMVHQMITQSETYQTCQCPSATPSTAASPCCLWKGPSTLHRCTCFSAPHVAPSLSHCMLEAMYTIAWSCMCICGC